MRRVDGHALGGEVCLVFGHDVACSQLACVQILGLPDDLQPASLKFFQAKEEQIVIGGLEASLRRFAHYDYWDNRVMKSILLDSKADLVLYGMGEKTIVQVIY